MVLEAEKSKYTEQVLRGEQACPATVWEAERSWLAGGNISASGKVALLQRQRGAL